MNAIHNFDEMVAHLRERSGKRRVAVVCPNDEGTRTAVCQAINEGFVEAVLVGCDAETE